MVDAIVEKIDLLTYIEQYVELTPKDVLLLDYCPFYSENPLFSDTKAIISTVSAVEKVEQSFNS